MIECLDSIDATTAAVFDLCASCYLSEDSHWGADCETLVRFAPKAGHILDVGCGPGWHIEWFLSQCHSKCSIVGIDKSEAMLALAERRIAKTGDRAKLLRGDATDIPFPPPEFDLVTCLNNTLGNLCADGYHPSVVRKMAVKEMFRATRPGGFVVISVYSRHMLHKKREYGKVFQLDCEASNIDAGDLVVKYCDPPKTSREGIAYYSHWFTEREFFKMIQDAGYKDIGITENGPRFVAVATKEQ